MRRYMLAFIIFLLGLALIFLSVIKEEGKVALILFIPVFFGTGIIAALGIILIIISFFIAFFSFFPTAEKTSFEKDIFEEKKKVEKKGGGVILIGPVPIAIGTDFKTTMLLVFIAFAIFFAFIIFILLIL
ncbi:MAG: DUF131 domain-containing protein [Candidatus Thermoplasmatota archaeon]